MHHFAGRGYPGKAMFIAIDKATAVRMFDKVKAHWDALVGSKKRTVSAKAPSEIRDTIAERLAWMRDTDMAVVVSQSQGEVAEMKAKGLDIMPHRKRMVEEDLDRNSKTRPIRFGSCSYAQCGSQVSTCRPVRTVYLDRPMKNHTLMQTIARANRRAPGKQAGIIVDYVGIFANLQNALAIYATPKGNDKPICDKNALIEQLEEALAEAETFCTSLGADLSGILAADKLLRAKRIGDAQEMLISPDERRRDFLRRADAAIRAYKALLPDEQAAPFLKRVAALAVVTDAIRNRLGPPDISAISDQIEKLLDANLLGIEITAPIHEGGDTDGLTDLSAIDFEKLAAAFAVKPRTTSEKLRTRATKKVRQMVAQNPTRVDLVERLEKLIDAYNTASIGVEELFERLKQFIRDLVDEEARAAREGLTEGELAIFDLLRNPSQS